MSENNTELIIYQTEDGRTKIDVHMENETVWLSLEQMSELFQRDKSTISRHIKNVFADGELLEEATVANFATVQMEGNREITRNITHYNLDVIISVGHWVKSLCGTQFRILREYQKYKRRHSGELSRMEQAFLESVETTAKRLEGK